jgi:ribonuclease HI
VIELFTDGSFDKETQFGGWAFVAYDGDREIYCANGGSKGTSSNQFEVLAVLNAAAWARAELVNSPILIWTDSIYVMEGVRRWLPIWRNNGWKKLDPNPRHRRRASPDRETWQALNALLLEAPAIEFDWCKGHSGATGNEKADLLATMGRLSPAASASAPGDRRNTVSC